MQNQTNRTATTPKGPTSAASNPFARALAEAEKMAAQGSGAKPGSKLEPSFPGLDKMAGSFPQLGGQDFDQAALIKEQQEKAKQEQLRRKLHDQVNPVDSTKLYDARQKQVKEEIDKLRHELKLLAKEVALLNKDVELTLMTEVGPKPGMDGKYYITFFQQLRSFIVLLRQKVRSARTWATQLNTKKKKKKMVGAGIVIEGSGHEQTKGVYDMMHHERSNAYGG